ncbi:MAG: iron chelate uptake ABC transporter family permease subunit [Phycisphaerales bacterium]
MISFDIGADLFPLVACTLASICCGLLGNFLVLRRQSLMGDAISHSVLPGLVIAFLVAAEINPYVMFAGAALAGVATVVLIEVVKRVGNVEPGAAMGVVFSIMFALGVLLIEQAAARNIDLDAGCVLYGQPESLAWFGAPSSFGELFSWRTIEESPRQVSTLLAMTILAVVFVTVFFKELRIAAFDPALATSLGFNAAVLHYALMIAVACATVASFEAVGSILVIAMLVCPAASARLVSDRLLAQILWSVAFATASGLVGYFAAIAVPAMFDRDAVSIAGSMTVVAGLLFTLTAVASPTQGVLARSLRQRGLARDVALEDLLATIYRRDEHTADNETAAPASVLLQSRRLQSALGLARKKNLVTGEPASPQLTNEGRGIAEQLVRKHRLWEDYLVRKAGVAPDHVHETAERLEHYDPTPIDGPDQDPHGKPIP